MPCRADGLANRNTGESKMNEDRMKGGWKEFKGKIKEHWGKLTDDELDVAEGKRDQIVGAIQRKYGLAKDEAERQYDEFEHANVSSTYR
jgi:uncharacterized protein YjbJ (UPF0337 family)